MSTTNGGSGTRTGFGLPSICIQVKVFVSKSSTIFFDLFVFSIGMLFTLNSKKMDFLFLFLINFKNYYLLSTPEIALK
jgi:hypothetical protein